MSWQTLAYNYHWSDYAYLFRGGLARAAATVPVFGYLIIFNDGIAYYLSFEKIAPQVEFSGFFSSDTRLRLIYFGLIFLGAAELLYLARRPHIMKLGDSFEKYKSRVLSYASPRYFIEANSSIKRSDSDPWTQGGKYYDRDYEDLMEMCLGSRPGQSIREAYESGKKANWQEAITRFEPLVTGIMEEIYFKEGRKRRVSLSIAVFMAVVGYAFLLLPSADLFVRVTYITFFT